MGKAFLCASAVAFWGVFAFVIYMAAWAVDHYHISFP